tara:strand:+ start:2806 stop:2994 length:189 start_codon:yes stop_codon:yes gene_type:complete
MHNIKHIEYKIFSLNRFSLSSKENNEIQQDLKNSNILILGADSSVGLIYALKQIFFIKKNIN